MKYVIGERGLFPNKEYPIQITKLSKRGEINSIIDRLAPTTDLILVKKVNDERVALFRTLEKGENMPPLVVDSKDYEVADIWFGYSELLKKKNEDE